jgi:Zn-finger nucleic acid-binding protein
MDATEIRGVAITTCAKCAGIWVSGAALHELFAREKETAHIEEAFEAIFELEFNASKRICPACPERLLKAVIIENTELDFCLACKGFYFDKGELERVYPGVRGYDDEDDDDERPDGAGNFWSTLRGFLRGG